MQSTVIFFFFSLFLATCVFRTVHGHGFQCYPPGRGLHNTQSVLQSLPRRPDLRRRVLRVKSMDPEGMDADNCPHCLNGGGKGAVVKASKGRWTPYEPLNKKMQFRHDSGLCGDPISMRGPRDHEAMGKYYNRRSPITATYKQGSVVEFIVDLTTNHQGYFEYFICDAQKCGGDINASCFKRGHCHQLMREKNPVCESAKSMECAPVDPKYPGRWYIGCRKGAHVGEHFVGGKYMRYHLPKDFNTKHAVLQWYWVTANSCNPPGFIDYFKNYPMHAWGKCGGDGGTIGGRNPSIAECGGKTFPEEFWNCADVEINASGKPSGGILPAPTPNGNGNNNNDDTPEQHHGDDSKKDDLVEKKGSANNNTKKNAAVNQPKSSPAGRTKRAQPKPQKPVAMHRPKKSHAHSHRNNQPKKKKKQHNPTKNSNTGSRWRRQNGWKPKRRSTTPWKKNNNNRRHRQNWWRVQQRRMRRRRHNWWMEQQRRKRRRRHNRWMAQRRRQRRRRNQWMWKRRAQLRRRRRWQRQMNRRRQRFRRRAQWRRRNHNRNRNRKSYWRKRSNRRRSWRDRGRRRNLSKKKGWGWKNGKQCARKWNQCGGKFYRGPRNCCKRNYKCVRVNPYYSHCKWRR